MSKEERIKAKQAELMAIFTEIDDNRLTVASDLIKQAAFMSATLEDLAEIISEEGLVEEYCNGQNQRGRKVSSNAKMYATLIGKYDAIVSKLLNLLPKSNVPARPEPILTKIKKTNMSDEKIDRQIARDTDFFKALKDGEIQQSDYHNFCEEWERQHVV